ncbi:MAG: hypothetical protein ABEK59_05740 [Halobacteria archaeon]
MSVGGLIKKALVSLVAIAAVVGLTYFVWERRTHQDMEQIEVQEIGENRELQETKEELDKAKEEIKDLKDKLEEEA